MTEYASRVVPCQVLCLYKLAAIYATLRHVTPQPDTPGGIIRARRLQKKRSLDQLAQEVGTSRRTVIRWEKDEMLPGPGYRKRLIRALELDAKAFDAFLQPVVTPARLARRLTALEQAVARIERHLFDAGAGEEG